MVKSVWATLSDEFVLDFDDIGRWPGHVKVWVCVLLFGFGIVLGAVFWIKPEKQQVALLQQKLDEANLKLSLASSRLSAFESLTERKAGLVRKLENKKQHLVGKHNNAHIAARLDSIAHIAHVDMTELSWNKQGYDPNKLTTHRRLIEKPLALTVQGNYHQLAQFIAMVGDASLYLVTQQFTLKPHVVSLNEHESGQLRLSFKGAVYAWST